MPSAPPLAKRSRLWVGAWVPGRVGAVLERPWFWIIVMALVFGVPLYRSFTREPPALLPNLGQVEQVSIIDQNGKPLSFDWLRGSAVVIGFIDTTCTTPECEQVLDQMARLQNRLLSVGFTVRILSWGSDPARDTPERLRALGDSRAARFKTWTFVTGEVPTVLAPIAEQPGSFALLDQLGRLRWSGTLADTKAMNLLVRDIAILINSDSALSL